MAGAIRYEKGQDDVVVLTMDMPGRSANIMNDVYREVMAGIIARLEAEKEGIASVVLISVKKAFFVGGDLNELIKVTKADVPVFYQGTPELKGQLRCLEAPGRPVAATISGTALGGGWEICLACHHRIALDNPSVQFSLPKVTLSPLSGSGGVICMVCLFDLEKTLSYLVEDKEVHPAEALKAGLVHGLADSPEEMLEKARTWILANPTAKRPWDNAGYKVPGGTPTNLNVAQMLAIAPSVLRDKTKGYFPAPKKIMRATMEGARVNSNTTQLIEARYFTELATGQVAKNMISTFWFQLNEINAGKSRLQGYPVQVAKEVGVIGAGMMDAGIAYVSAVAGIEVVLKDISLEVAGRGKAYSTRLLDKKVVRGHLSAEKRDAFLARIVPSVSEADFGGYDLIVGAVFEDRALKDKVTVEAERHTLAGVVVASNTSTLPITGLAQAVVRPEKFIGLHSFSPVDKMPLVETTRGEKTSDEILARGFNYVLQIKKTSIVVNDSRSFFTSRMFGTFTNEDTAALGEDVSAMTIDNQARQAGMPVGPLAISNEASLGLMTHTRNQTVYDPEVKGRTLLTRSAFAMIDLMVNEYERPGEAAGADFYDYPASGREYLWAELKSCFEKPDAQIFAEDVCNRLLSTQAVKTMCCVEEGVLHSTAGANIGSVFGVDFAAWSGGALQFINQYDLKDSIACVQYLVEQYGERFGPPALLLERTTKDELL